MNVIVRAMKRLPRPQGPAVLHFRLQRKNAALGTKWQWVACVVAPISTEIGYCLAATALKKPSYYLS